MPLPVIFSGIQPTGNLHLGNWLGAVKYIVELQNTGQYQAYYFVADYHSLTGELTAEARRANTLTLAAELMAAGLDPAHTTLFVQSHVPEHAELTWILNCVTPVPELFRMTQFKDKSGRQKKNINTGLLTYPVLQAADILLYHTAAVPVGQDQVQHLELTNDIVRWFNRRYGDCFKPIKPLLTKIPKVMSLLEPEKKMSKSLGAGHVIELADEPAVIEKKLAKAVTATAGGGKSPGAENLLLLLKQFGDVATYQNFAAAEKQGTIRYAELKAALAAAIGSYFADFRNKRAVLLKNPGQIEAALEAGAERARAVAETTMAEVRRRVGTGYPLSPLGLEQSRKAERQI